MKKKSILSCMHFDKDGGEILPPDNGNHKIHVNFYLGKIAANRLNYLVNMTNIEYFNSIVCKGLKAKIKNGVENIHTDIAGTCGGFQEKKGLKDWCDIVIADKKGTLKRVREEIADYWVDNSNIIRGNDITFDVKTFSKDSKSDPFAKGLKRYIREQIGSCREESYKGIKEKDFIPLEKRDLDYVRNGINSTKPNKIERLRKQNVLMQYKLARALI